jgi:predicted RNA-binding Zn-ribbon protein involved in translation (DUF1610 family)
MGLFDRKRQAERLGDEPEDGASFAGPAVDDPKAGFSPPGMSGERRWRLKIEMALTGFGAVVLSVLLIWATITDRVSVEAIVVILVVLLITLFAVAQGVKYHTQNLALQERAHESITKTTLAAEIMMEFLREFTLKNQETISHLAEHQKVRVIDDLEKAVDDLGRFTTDAGMRRELAQLKEVIARKVMEIPTGVSFPLPRLEQFDLALRQMEETEHTLKCTACGGGQVRVSRVDSRRGLQYICNRCGHEFTVGITVMLEKNA